MWSVFQDLSIPLLCHPKHQTLLRKAAKRLFHLGSDTRSPFTKKERKGQGATGNLNPPWSHFFQNCVMWAASDTRSWGTIAFHYLGQKLYWGGRMTNATPLQKQVSISKEKGKNKYQETNSNEQSSTDDFFHPELVQIDWAGLTVG